MVRYLFEIGPTVGDCCISWPDVGHWQSVTGVELDEFSAGTVIKLSRVYLGTLQQAREESFPPPFKVERELSPRMRAAILAAEAERRNEDH